MTLPTKAEVKDWIEQIDITIGLLEQEANNSGLKLNYAYKLLTKQKQLLKDLLKGLKQ